MTQTVPSSPTASSSDAKRSVIGLAARRVAGSIRTTLAPSAIQTAFGPTATAVPGATFWIALVRASMRMTDLSVASATQTAPNPTATSFGPWRSSIVSVTPPRRGSKTESLSTN